jgi:hypothetical protein
VVKKQTSHSVLKNWWAVRTWKDVFVFCQKLTPRQSTCLRTSTKSVFPRVIFKITKYSAEFFSGSNHHHHHHHHHVQEGLDVFRVPWSSKWNWSFHLFLGRPMWLRLFGLYCNACLVMLFVSILCMCCSHFSWYCFIFFIIFCASVFSLVHWFLFLSGLKSKFYTDTIFINLYPANVENKGELLIMPADGRWDLSQRLKGYLPYSR